MEEAQSAAATSQLYSVSLLLSRCRLLFSRLGGVLIGASTAGAIIPLLVVSTQRRDNVSWVNERQRREAALTSIDPCKKMQQQQQQFGSEDFSAAE